MIKKRYLAIVGLAVLAAAAAGCGKKSSSPVIEVTPTAAAEATPTAAAQNMVDMEVIEETNTMGEKTSTASQLTIVNQTGSEVGAIYIREHPSDEEEDDEWGSDLVNGSFTLANGENAVYYFEKGASATLYDIRITYTEEDKNECFFRSLPLNTITKITLRMDGTGEDSIPYATYLTSGSTSEYSTLNDVKERLGLSTDDEDDEDEDTLTPTPEPDATSTPSPDDPADPTSTPEPDDPEPEEDPDKETAKSYIGASLDDLISSIGSANSDEYDEDEEQGRTGYHYYSSFTVYTTVDDNGNEIVSGVW